jgi:diaminopimelate epimerase
VAKAIFAAMRIRFEKWHGAGNDFIVIDDRSLGFRHHDAAAVERLCDRHLGVGSDGLVLIQSPKGPGSDFHMEFLNPDGSRSFCGNGSRCAFAAWSAWHGSVGSARFTAFDGEHVGRWQGDQVMVTIRPVERPAEVRWLPSADFVDTGSPHLLIWTDRVREAPLAALAPPLRHDARFGAGGTNVNLVEMNGSCLRMRTFERGVEAETLSCGSGVVAAALSAITRHGMASPVKVETMGGVLQVEATVDEAGFREVRLLGPAQLVFVGEIAERP